MPVFMVTSPDGRKLKVTGPEGSTREDAIAQAKAFFGKPENQLERKQENGGFFKNLATDTKNFVKSTAYSVPVGFGDEIRDGMAALTAGALSPDLTVREAYDQARELTREEQAQMQQDSPIASVAGDITGAVLTGVGTAGTKAGASLANSLRSGNPLTLIAKGIGTGAVSGAAYGAGTAEEDNRLRGAVKGSIAGGITGGALPAIGSAASGLKSTVAPKIEKPIADLAQRAKDFGIPLRLDQVSPTRARNTVQKISQNIPGSGVDAFETIQRKAVAKALAKEIGQDADDLGPSVIQAFRNDVSKKFDKALDGQTIAIDSSAQQAIADIVDEAAGTIDDSLVSVVKKNADDLLAQIQTGSISGEKLSSVRSQLLKRSTKAKNEAGQFLNDLIDVIDNNIDKNLPPEKIAELAEARLQWRNFKTIQPLLNKSTDGTINPTELLNRVSSNKFIDASKVKLGEDNLIDIARIGKELIKIKGGSDTFSNQALGYGSAGLALGAVTNPLAALAAAATAGTGMVANRGFQAVNSSQKLIDLAIRNSGKATKQIKARPSTLLIPGTTGGIVAQ